MDQMLFEGRACLPFDIVSAATDVGLLFPFAMLEMLFDRGVFLAEQQIDEEPDGGPESDLEAKEDERKVPIRPEIAKQDRQGLVAASEENGNQGPGREVAFEIEVRPDDARAAFRDEAEKGPESGSEATAFLEDAGDLPFEEREEDVQQKDHPEDDGGILQCVKNHIPHAPYYTLFSFSCPFFSLWNHAEGKPLAERDIPI